jgi:CRP-like cAMP-binding protein
MTSILNSLLGDRRWIPPVPEERAADFNDLLQIFQRSVSGSSGSFSTAFSSLSAHEQEEVAKSLAESATLVSYPATSLIQDQVHEIESFHILISGAVALWNYGQSNSTNSQLPGLTGIRVGGDSLGSFELIMRNFPFDESHGLKTNRPRSSAFSVTPVTAVKISINQLIAKDFEKSPVYSVMARNVIQYLQKNSHNLAGCLSNSVEAQAMIARRLNCLLNIFHLVRSTESFNLKSAEYQVAPSERRSSIERRNPGSETLNSFFDASNKRSIPLTACLPPVTIPDLMNFSGLARNTVESFTRADAQKKTSGLKVTDGELKIDSSICSPFIYLSPSEDVFDSLSENLALKSLFESSARKKSQGFFAKLDLPDVNLREKFTRMDF